jgi:WD40 repeat protein
MDHPGTPQLLTGYTGHISFLDFEKKDTQLYSGGDDETIRNWHIGVKTEGSVSAHTSLVPAGMAVSENGDMGAVSLPDGQVELWNLHDSSTKLATIVFPGTGGWLVHTSEGLFEASENAWKDANFRFENRAKNVAPIEGYFSNYFDPGLLSDILSGETTPHPADPVKLDRRSFPVPTRRAPSSLPRCARLTYASSAVVIVTPDKLSSVLGNNSPSADST